MFTSGKNRRWFWPDECISTNRGSVRSGDSRGSAGAPGGFSPFAFFQAQNLNSFTTNYFLTHFQEFFQKLGNVEITAYQKALTILHLLVKKKAMVASFDDCFFIAGVTFLLALIPTALLRVHNE